MLLHSPCLRVSVSPHLRVFRSAFTLVEMVVVLFIISLVIGIAVMSFEGMSGEQELKRPVNELQRMTQEAVSRASLYERPQTIRFDSKGFSMRYQKDADGRVASDDNKVWQRRINLPDGMKLSLRRFGTDRFAPAAGQVLTVAPGGLCEPIAARFELDRSWIEVLIDPLSGSIQDQRMTVQ
jgi:type II secretion system protein H